MTPQLLPAAQEWQLRCHPASPCPAVSTVSATICRMSAAALHVQYAVQGDLQQIRVPPVVESGRRDELWRHTCAELFLAAPDQEPYCEFNFSPATEWAAYEFTACRQGMRPAECVAPSVKVSHSPQLLTIQVEVNVSAALAVHTHWQAGLTMVIEDVRGQCSYWALSHGSERPDFHARDGFVLVL